MKCHLLVVLIACLSGGLSAQTTREFPASRDVALGYHDFYNTANNNYGNALQNGAYYIPGHLGGINSNRAMIDFDLSSIPSGAVISKATLNLYAYTDYPEQTMAKDGHFGDNESFLRRITTAWDEYTAIWNMQPQTTLENQVILARSNYGDEDYVNIDVTSMIIDILKNPSESHGFMLGLMQEKEYANLSFHSKEGSDSTKYPVLKVVYQYEQDPDDPDDTDPNDTDPNEDDPSDPSDDEDIGAIPQEPEIPVNPHDFNFIIYPNPGRKMLTIEFTDGESKHIKIYTLEGKILFSQDTKAIIKEIVVRDLAPGVYFIQCNNEVKSIIRKYVKMAR